MHIKEKIYEKLPTFSQNILTSIYGVKLYYKRYMGNYKKYLEELLKTQWISKEDIFTYQTNELRNLINSAYQYVPYYHKLFRQLNLTPSDFNTLTDLKKLPILDKETVRIHVESLLARNISKRKITTLNTSGTTGKSLKIYVDLDSRRKEYAFITRSQIWAGLTNSKNNITFGGRVIIPANQKKKVFWRYNAIMNNYLFSSYHLSEENIPYYIEKIKEIKPKFIDSYPSSIYTLAKFMEEKGISGIYPQAILTTAETLLDYQRDTIERVFKCPVFDQYGCTEQAVFISQCENGSYHIHPEYGIVEILDENGNDVGHGEVGKVVCTGLINKAMLLIRYDIGDYAMREDGICKCGRNFPLIKKIYGRQDDFIITPDGRRVGRLDPIFKGLTSIKMAQIIQTKLDEIDLIVVPGSTYTYKDGKILQEELRKRVGKTITINIKLVENISISSSGKFRSVISRISK